MTVMARLNATGDPLAEASSEPGIGHGLSIGVERELEAS